MADTSYSVERLIFKLFTYKLYSHISQFMSRDAFRSDYVKEHPILFSRQHPLIIINQDSKQENKKIPNGGFIMNIGILPVAVIGGTTGRLPKGFR